METIFKIIGVALLTCFAVMLIKPVRNDFAILIGVVGGLIILAFVIGYVSTVMDFFKVIIEKTGISQSLLSLVMKVVGIGYLTEFSASLCADCGNSSLGDKLLFAGKIVLLVISMPIVMNILNIVTELMPWKKI